MKKFLSLLLAFVIIISLVACTGSNEQEQKRNLQETEYSEPSGDNTYIFMPTESTEQVQERDFPEGDYPELGDGTAYISTSGGTSKDGNTPVIYVGNEIMMQIGLNAWDFNGGALSFIYVDGVLIGKEQLANTQASITLGEAQLAEGIHTVEVVQYTNDEPESEMVTYKSMQYQVKEK